MEILEAKNLMVRTKSTNRQMAEENSEWGGGKQEEEQGPSNVFTYMQVHKAGRLYPGQSLAKQVNRRLQLEKVNLNQVNVIKIHQSKVQREWICDDGLTNHHQFG